MNRWARRGDEDLQKNIMYQIRTYNYVWNSSITGTCGSVKLSGTLDGANGSDSRTGVVGVAGSQSQEAIEGYLAQGLHVVRRVRSTDGVRVGRHTTSYTQQSHMVLLQTTYIEV